MDLSTESFIEDDPIETINCTWTFLIQNGLEEDYIFGNETRDYEAQINDSQINCREFHHFEFLNCSLTDYICICAKELYRMKCKESPAYYSYIYRIIGTLFQGIIFVIGVIGNIMVVIVVAKNRNMSTPTNCYLVSLAVADCAVLVAAVPQEIVSYYLIGNHWIWGEFGCAAMIFIQYLGINASSLSLTAFTVERYIAICHIMLAQYICTVKRAKKITIFVWIFAIAYCSPWLFLTKVQPMNYDINYPTQECTFKLSREYYLYYYLLDIIVFYVIPLVLSVVLYSLMARTLLFGPDINPNAIRTPSMHGSQDGHGRRKNTARVQVFSILILT